MFAIDRFYCKRVLSGDENSFLEENTAKEMYSDKVIIALPTSQSRTRLLGLELDNFGH
jgi:hypothetical protein